MGSSSTSCHCCTPRTLQKMGVAWLHRNQTRSQCTFSLLKLLLLFWMFTGYSTLLAVFWELDGKEFLLRQLVFGGVSKNGADSLFFLKPCGWGLRCLMRANRYSVRLFSFLFLSFSHEHTCLPPSFHFISASPNSWTFTLFSLCLPRV